MVINVELVREDNGNIYTAYFKEEGNPNIVAYATNEADDCDKHLYFNDKEYVFADKRSVASICDLTELRWESSGIKGKSICQKVYKDGECIAQHYGVSLKPLKSKRKGGFGATVYEYKNTHYTVYQVGFTKESSHFYCIYDNAFQCIGVIERRYGDDIRSSIYIEDETHLLIAIMVCMEETICALHPSSDRDHRHDSSAGNYISICQDEKELLDRNFINRVKAQQDLKAGGWLADRMTVYNDDVVKRSQMVQEIKTKTDKATSPIFIFACVILCSTGFISMFNFIALAPLIALIIVAAFLVLVAKKSEKIKKEVKDKYDEKKL